MTGASSTPAAGPTRFAGGRRQAIYRAGFSYCIGRLVYLALENISIVEYARGRADGWRTRGEVEELARQLDDAGKKPGPEAGKPFHCSSSGGPACGQVLRGYRSYPCSEDGPHRSCRDAANGPQLSGHVD